YTQSMLLLTAALTRIIRRRRSGRYAMRRTYSLMENVPRQVRHLNMVLSDHNSACLDSFRMSRNTFAHLCELLHGFGLRSSRHVSATEKLAMFLGILAHHTKVRIQRRDCNRSTWTVNKHFYTVLRVILRLHNQLQVNPVPVTPENATTSFLPFQNCLGALDGSYVPVRVKEADKARYRNRKGFVATNVLGVCDQHMNFIYVLAGWEGSAADSRVLRDALRRDHGLRVPPGHYYLCDSGYMDCDGFLTPYRGVRYHLREWGPGMQGPQNAKEYFNMKHASARNVIERAWGILKSRWAILRSPYFYPIRTQTAIILACTLLHNFIRRDVETDPVEIEIEDEFQDNNETNAASTVLDSVGAHAPSPEWTRRRDDM
ncbi:hypothetical protein M569_02213, partial [Genlisea aurea]